MNILGLDACLSRPRLNKQILVALLSLALFFLTSAQSSSGHQDQQAPAQPAEPAQPPYTQQTPEQLQQLVAPIAQYPDSLVAQILAASTFPAQVVEADRWLQANPDLKDDALAQAVNQQPWDPSVKALTAFPTVLGNMDKNLSWTSSLGDAYYNQQHDLLDAIQVMREMAQQAGTLKSTPQQNVETQDSTIEIEPASPDVVYVPAYNPWLVYGYPIVAWPGWYPYPGIWYEGPFPYYGVGFGIGYFGGYGWGWGRWGFDWQNHYAVYNHNRYYSTSNTFYNRNNYYRAGGDRGVATNVQGGVSGDRSGSAENSRGVYNSPGATTKPFSGNTQAMRGYGEPRAESDVRSDALSGYDHGGEARSYSSRGSASYGGGGSHGGGGGHGGGHR